MAFFVKDVRIRGLINVEQHRLDRLQAVIDHDTPSTHKNALAFLGTTLGKAAVKSRLATESEVEAKRKITRRFVRREQALIRHDFNAVSPPPPLRCPHADCDATFVDRGHCVRHAADAHPTDAPEVAELSATMRDPVSLAVFEQFIKDAALNKDDIVLQLRPGQQEVAGQAKDNKQGTTADNVYFDGIAAARDTLDMWKAIEEWRAVPTSSSSGDLYRKLGASILVRFASGTTAETGQTRTPNDKRLHLPDDIRVALGGEQLLRLFGKLGTTYHKKNSDRISIKSLLGGNHHHSGASERPSSSPSDGGDDQVHLGNVEVEPFALEEASFRAVVFLSESAIGQAFLRSAPYERYLHRARQPREEAVCKAAADIAAAEIEAWAAEGRRLRKAALDNQQELLMDSLADKASNVVLRGAAGAGLLGELVDHQVTNSCI